MQKVIHTVLNVGAEKPFKILHITDVHLTFTNEKDSEDHIALEKRRWDTFRKEGNFPPMSPSEYFEEAIRMAEELDALLVVTGDVMDIQTQGNIEEFHRIADGHDMMFTPGGHEMQKRCHRTLEEPDAYWIGSREKLKAAFPEFDMDFSNRIVNGVNLICADNSLDYYNAETLRRFKEEQAKGLPIILFSHDPMRTGHLNCKESWCEYITLTEEDFKLSHEMIGLIRNDPKVVAYFTGHSHAEIEQKLESGSICYETPGLYAGICRLIEVR
ncbi:MAG: metallophosphoesterase [Clostridia bacterium]|nr:metallophosphoesterase [Clostridia bacterium]